MSNQLLQEFEAKFKKKNKVEFKVGDIVKVYTKIIEGEKERIQTFSGIVIAMKGKGLSQTFSVYRSAYGCNMERIFFLHSPRITKIKIEKKGKVGKSKLYNLRGVSGKKARVKEQILKKEASSVEPMEGQLPEPLIEEEKVIEKEMPKVKKERPKKKEPKDKKEK